MWNKIKAGLGLNKQEIAERIVQQARAESVRTAAETSTRIAREKRVQAKVKRTEKLAELARLAAEKEKLIGPKEEATANGQPWVEVLGIEVNEEDPGQGSFELDWNDLFIAKLIRAGYQGKTDQDLVDNWFKAVCRNVVTETYEQEQADPEKRAESRRRDLGNGRTEVS